MKKLLDKLDEYLEIEGRRTPGRWRPDLEGWIVCGHSNDDGKDWHVSAQASSGQLLDSESDAKTDAEFIAMAGNTFRPTVLALKRALQFIQRVEKGPCEHPPQCCRSCDAKEFRVALAKEMGVGE